MDEAAVFGIVIFAILVIIFGPMLVLWAINVLILGAGGSAIALCFKTWFATFLIMGLIGGGSAASVSS